MTENEIKYLEGVLQDYKENKERKIQVLEWLEKIEKDGNRLSKFMSIDFDKPLSKKNIGDIQNLQQAMKHGGARINEKGEMVFFTGKEILPFSK